MVQCEAEIIHFVKRCEPVTAYRVHIDLGLAETTVYQVLKQMVADGRLDCVETRYRKLYSVSKTIKEA